MENEKIIYGYDKVKWGTSIEEVTDLVEINFVKKNMENTDL